MRRFHSVRVLVAAVGASLLLGVLVVYGVGRDQAKPLNVFGNAPAFTLTDHLERPVRSDELRGKVVVASFIYTRCRDICPLLSLRMQALQERLRQERLLGGQVQLLSFTTDPASDTAPVLRAYAERHQADPSAWRFLTGPEQEIKQLIVQGFLLGVQKVTPRETATGEPSDNPGDDEYDVMHSGRFVLIGPE